MTSSGRVGPGETVPGTVGGVPRLVEGLFRRSYGRLLAALTRTFGPERLPLAEEVVQEALLRALETWPYRGVPEDPEGWLVRVARNGALDRLRRDAAFGGRLAAAAGAEPERWIGSAAVPRVSDELTMLLLCCHPALPPVTQVMLMLNTVGGFGAREVAAAFLLRPAAAAQRLVRAKRTLRESAEPFTRPSPGELAERLERVLRGLYLLFNEGYAPHSGSAAVRPELCREAIRLGRLVVADASLATPAARALLALMLLHASRLPAREAEGGAAPLLGDQDRTRWDRRALVSGLRELDAAAAGDRLTAYHLEAAIAACHAMASEAADTDWRRIVELYDALLELAPTPVARLNRAVAVARASGAAAGLAEVDALAEEPRLARYHLLPAVRGALLGELGRRSEAAAAYDRALRLAESGHDRAFLAGRLAELQI